MILEETFTIPAPLESVWPFLLDIPRVSVCAPGVENVEQVAPDVYRGLMKVRVGPMAAAFSGQVTILERVEAEKLAVRIEGADKSSASTVGATFTARLTPLEGSTQIHYTMDVTLRGRLAQFGLTVVQGTAKKITAEFARCLQASL
jgi:carbon monoxide dehydrogenase subunit G